MHIRVSNDCYIHASMAKTSAGTKRGGGRTRGGRRTLYTPEQKRLVSEQYQFCVTREEKMALARRAGLQSLEQLYNLANRLGVTRTHQERIARHGLERDQVAFSEDHLHHREDPETVVFTAEQDTYLRRHFGRAHIEQISFHIGHSEIATAVRARQLELRRFCRYWEGEKVTAWLARSEDELKDWGVEFFACNDRNGRHAITLVSTTSLLRLFADPRYRDDLDQGRPDLFFVKELKDLLAEVAGGAPMFEASRWVSHGHICLNPWSGVSFRLFDDGSDQKMFGRDLHPADLTSAGT